MSMRLVVVILLCLHLQVFSQTTRKIYGEILNEGSRPIQGLSVIEIGTSNGTATDMNGKFSLQVPNKGVVYILIAGKDSKIYLKYSEVEIYRKFIVNPKLRKQSKKIKQEWEQGKELRSKT